MMVQATMGLDPEIKQHQQQQPKEQPKQAEAGMLNAIGADVTSLNRSFEAAFQASHNCNSSCQDQPAPQTEFHISNTKPHQLFVVDDNDNNNNSTTTTNVVMVKTKASTTEAAASPAPVTGPLPSSGWKDVPQAAPVSSSPSPSDPVSIVAAPTQYQQHQQQQETTISATPTSTTGNNSNNNMLMPPTNENDQPFVNVYMLIDPKSMTCLIPQQTISCKRNNVVATAIMGPRMLSAPTSSASAVSNSNNSNNNGGNQDNHNMNMNETMQQNKNNNNNVQNNSNSNQTTDYGNNSNNNANMNSNNNSTNTSSSLMAQINNTPLSFANILQEQFQLDELLGGASMAEQSTTNLVTPPASVSGSTSMLSTTTTTTPMEDLSSHSSFTTSSSTVPPPPTTTMPTTMMMMAESSSKTNSGTDAAAASTSAGAPTSQQQDNYAPLPPLRALSAYNFFFRDERERILHPDLSPDWSEDKKLKLLQEHWWQDRNKKRKHRKTHGKINFTTLSKLISARWKELPEDRKDFYRQIASRDFERFKRENQTYQQEQATRALPSVPPMMAPAAVVG